MFSPTSKTVPDNTFATFVKDDFTVILSTKEEPYIINAETFNFQTSYVFIYAEKVEITGSIEIKGKNLGIFCSDISVKGGDKDGSEVVIDVSGRHGDTQSDNPSEDGRAGGNGEKGGDVWLFVQNGVEDTLKKLEIKAFGGDGGKGGNAGPEKKGGNGGNGGNGG